VGRLNVAAIDAVTIDGFGTLLSLVDPIPRLRALLPEQSPQALEAAFQAEAEYYLAHSAEGKDEAGLARLRAACTDVFNQAIGANLTPDQYVGALEFEILPGVRDALTALRARGLALAVVANWDYSLHEQLARQQLDHFFATVVLSAEVGAAKPDPAAFYAALERVGVPPTRALHVGDSAADEEGAAAAGMAYAPAPLVTLLEALT
jgi:putative hydrolase of the HAD superfamily